MSWQKVVLLLIVILIVTRIIAPDTAEWIRSLIENTIYRVLEATLNFGG